MVLRDCIEPGRAAPVTELSYPARAAPAMARAAASVPAPEAAADADARLEDRYVAALHALHALIAARTEPPRDAAYRLTHPSGTVEVTFVLE
jgi:hypothetical protein